MPNRDWYDRRNLKHKIPATFWDGKGFTEEEGKEFKQTTCTMTESELQGKMVMKFRAWDHQDHAFHTPMTLFNMMDICCKIEDLPYMGVKFKMTRESLEYDRFTGLLDVEGKEVYEYDFLQCDDGDYTDVVNIHLVLSSPKQFGFTSFRICAKNLNLSGFTDLQYCRNAKIIGNMRMKNILPTPLLSNLQVNGIDIGPILKSIEWEGQQA